MMPIYLDSIGTILCALLLASDRKAAFVCAWLAAAMSVTTGKKTTRCANAYWPTMAVDVSAARTRKTPRREA